MNEDQGFSILCSGDPVTSRVRPYSTRAGETEVCRQWNQLRTSRLALWTEGDTTQERTSSVREVSGVPCHDDVINARNAWRQERIGCYFGTRNGIVNRCHTTRTASD